MTKKPTSDQAQQEPKAARPQGTVVYKSGQPVLYLDSRRRTSLAKVGLKTDTCYLVEQFRDGSLLLVPATTLAIAEVEELRAAAKSQKPGEDAPTA